MAQINKPVDHFNTLLYSGTGSARTVTGVGFQPDFFWIKQRSSNQGHLLWDTIRNGNYYLPSSNDVAQANDIGTFTAASDGYSFATDGAYNGNSSTYVGWNWLAAGSTPSKTYTVKVVDDSGNKYRFDDFGTSAVTLELSEGGTYTFDQSDSSNSGHPLRFYTASDKSGGEYTTGVTTNGTPGSSGAYTRITVASSAPTLYYQCSAHAGMGGQANTPTTNSFSNFDGSIQSNVSPSTTAGFSIVSYTGTGSAQTVGHGLSSVPKMILFKCRDNTDEWRVYHVSISATKFLRLNGTNATTDSPTFMFNGTTPTSSVFSVGAGNSRSGNGHIAYCFAEKKGYSKFGAYKGNGQASDGPVVYLGFSPAFVIIKRTDAADDWRILDNKRSSSTHNPINKHLYADSNAVEGSSSTNGVADGLDFLSTGFKVRQATNGLNASGGDYVFMAFAEQPLVGTNNVPATAR